MEQAIEGISSLCIVENVIVECYLGDQTMGRRTVLKLLKGDVR
jgi:hypothetical protein